jgi:hypothetical protein
MKTFKKSISALLAAISMVSTQAHAEQWCQTKINFSAITIDGRLKAFLAVRGDWVDLCNIKVTTKGVTPEVCSKWSTYVHSAVARRADVSIYYSEATACSAIPTHENAPAPYFITLLN